MMSLQQIYKTFLVTGGATAPVLVAIATSSTPLIVGGLLAAVGLLGAALAYFVPEEELTAPAGLTPLHYSLTSSFFAVCHALGHLYSSLSVHHPISQIRPLSLPYHPTAPAALSLLGIVGFFLSTFLASMALVYIWKQAPPAAAL